MIQVTRYGGEEVSFYVNADLILFIESSPETVLTLSDGKKLRVRESVEEVLKRIVDFKRRTMPVVVPEELSRG